MAQKKEKKIRVTQIRSIIGQKPSHRKTIEALGLKKIGQSKEFNDTPQIRGMITKVNHMLTWEEID
ncbi:MAG: 50S ribosomal protein L30 [Desulfobacterales bacterium PC51MH44]|nr:50S ribosomal protein L30 [Calditrichia bacterium]OEU67054.1 MAG: 50S ribosomal protein L30 [Desulfobacterales bacterium PC51MH44]